MTRKFLGRFAVHPSAVTKVTATGKVGVHLFSRDRFAVTSHPLLVEVEEVIGINVLADLHPGLATSQRCLWLLRSPDQRLALIEVARARVWVALLDATKGCILLLFVAGQLLVIGATINVRSAATVCSANSVDVAVGDAGRVLSGSHAATCGATFNGVARTRAGTGLVVRTPALMPENVLKLAGKGGNSLLLHECPLGSLGGTNRVAHVLPHHATGGSVGHLAGGRHIHPLIAKPRAGAFRDEIVIVVVALQHLCRIRPLTGSDRRDVQTFLIHALYKRTGKVFSGVELLVGVGELTLLHKAKRPQGIAVIGGPDARNVSLHLAAGVAGSKDTRVVLLDIRSVIHQRIVCPLAVDYTMSIAGFSHPVHELGGFLLRSLSASGQGSTGLAIAGGVGGIVIDGANRQTFLGTFDGTLGLTVEVLVGVLDSEAAVLVLNDLLVATEGWSVLERPSFL